jgi:hypothetical protein
MHAAAARNAKKAKKAVCLLAPTYAQLQRNQLLLSA